MNNQEQFAEFLHCCREQRVKRIHLAEPCLIVNSSAGDFGSILIEFEQSNYFITSNTCRTSWRTRKSMNSA